VLIEEGFTEGNVVHTSVGSCLPFLFYHPPAKRHFLWGDPDPVRPTTTCELFSRKLTTIESLA
jgi:hypothetical protein